MIQDIFPSKLNNSYRTDAIPKPDDLIIIHSDGKILLKVDEDSKTISFPRLKDFSIDLKPLYFFEIDGENFFYNTDTNIDTTSLPDGFQFYTMRQIRNEYLYPKHYVFASYTAIHLIDWYEANRFCGKCGTKNEHSKSERALVCPNCGHTRYPRINPAVIVGVKNGDKLLLTKYKTGFAHNALVAGFTEIGETMEETVEREVMEETGLKVKNIHYYKSQPWGIASDILLGYYCDVDGDDTITMDESELKYAQWVSREDIELQPLDYSLTNEMMKMFKENKLAD
ncbi:NAD+ diphosphatase [Pseudobutyrivibrio sp. C4]|uniref:NAD(+) diphosphatase n=1 Tax=Pseudobutyrivibrio sp. C4 TaxID=1520803 RepID=UPI0008CFEF0D|nr:NAD(+) diphosphatase [Pseudobutyrivibrio sp. C4]SET05116.1 NAD+ diphosphatase [Pseudobutyrivibrio sp. C4]